MNEIQQAPARSFTGQSPKLFRQQRAMISSTRLFQIPSGDYLELATRKELQQLAKLRLIEAEQLYAKRLYDGAVYLCGYVVESALKARICRHLRLPTYPERGEIGHFFKTHDFDVLKHLAGLADDITAAKNKLLYDNWSIVISWKPEQRYLPRGTYDQQRAKEVLASIQNVPNGVLTWLSKRW
jgi:HEPN domain-containing protein